MVLHKGILDAYIDGERFIWVTHYQMLGSGVK